MITKQNLIDNFASVAEIGNNIFKCSDSTPKSTYYYYIRLSESSSNEADFLIVSEGREDDEFALFVINNVLGINCTSSGLILSRLPSNKYNFSHVILAPKDYHAYFKGILDEQRALLTLCLPMHRCEFSGQESAQEFILMRKQTIQSLDWARKICPKIKLRFDNPKTQGGTDGKEVLVTYELVMQEIDRLDGVSNGFVEIKNYKDNVIEILSPSQSEYLYIQNRDDNSSQMLDKKNLLNRLWIFLVQ